MISYEDPQSVSRRGSSRQIEPSRDSRTSSSRHPSSSSRLLESRDSVSRQPSSGIDSRDTGSRHASSSSRQMESRDSIADSRHPSSSRDSRSGSRTVTPGDRSHASSSSHRHPSSSSSRHPSNSSTRHSESRDASSHTSTTRQIESSRPLESRDSRLRTNAQGQLVPFGDRVTALASGMDGLSVGGRRSSRRDTGASRLSRR